ncbi:MAG: 50S ribosomal protein L20 [Spirochaetes bacterium]|nr:50S ribosomal protein L20 [Spirochaetota bacterium]HOJ28700.1 50S ribosomal protein L20 [Spirochaetota bacterium]HOM10258.1 50S ribosomal protein L20 [Spirochaetota bacterium]HPP50501.1 50S ribosomal protein L20 [Spirochaetota bacterium]HXK66068.1 50S ribosomal protein L20 [Spirochaetota bacterium]
MPRATTGKVHHKRREKILKDVKGFYGARKNLWRTAKDARRKKLQNSYKDRRRKKRDFRALWIMRINAAARLYGISYSRLIDGMKKANILIDRKMLAELAVSDTNAFKAIVEKVTNKAA